MRISHLCLLTFFCFGTAHAAPKAVPAIAEPLSQKDGLQVSIGNIELRPSDPHIDVVLQNNSDKPIDIFNEGNSWGFNNLTLEVRRINGKVLTAPLLVARGYVPWRGMCFPFKPLNREKPSFEKFSCKCPRFSSTQRPSPQMQESRYVEASTETSPRHFEVAVVESRCAPCLQITTALATVERRYGRAVLPRLSKITTSFGTPIKPNSTLTQAKSRGDERARSFA